MRLLKTNQASSKLLSFFPAMMEEIEDWRTVSEAISGGARLAKVAMHIVACIPITNGNGNQNTNSSKEQEQQVLDHFFRLGFKLNQVKYDTLNTLITTLPFGLLESWPAIQKQKVPSTMLTSSCATLLPIFGDTQSYTNPLLMLVGKRGQVFFFDPYGGVENGNYNMVVVGKSGSGKSVFLQEYMFSILRQNGQVVVIDDGRSFKNSNALLGGDFVDFQGSTLCINPFSLYEYRAEALKDDKFKADFEEPLIDLTVSILCIVANIDKNNTKSFDTGLYRNLIKKAVQIVLEKYGNKAGFKEIKQELETNPELRHAQTAEIADKIAFVLKEYATGRYSSYFNGKATLSINNTLTVFELSSLESNEILQTSVLLTVVFLVYVKMQGREKRTSLIIDEAWRSLRHDAIKGFIEGIARRARKYNGNLVVATQSISDFDEKNSAAAAAVLSQSDWRVILSAEAKDEKILKDQLGMNEGEIAIANKLRGDKGRFSEFMIRHASGGWCVARMVIDPFSVKLYSSKAEDVTRIKKLESQGLSLEQAIERLMLEANAA
jgi:conjugal transfer ATP-binding protein TraC